jgi:hypothetical protein
MQVIASEATNRAMMNASAIRQSHGDVFRIDLLVPRNATLPSIVDHLALLIRGRMLREPWQKTKHRL